jgi:serine/threonine protein kinase
MSSDEEAPQAPLSAGPAGGEAPVGGTAPLDEGELASDPAPVGAPPTDTWGFAEGEEIAPGRSVLQRIGSPSELYDTYLVWDEQRFSIMVAKVIRPDHVGQDSARRSLKREALALTRLQHPVVVRAFEVVDHGDYPHVLLEHLEGFTLRSTVRREGALPFEQILPLALHIASALHYFAREGYVHLDVKPANVIMGVPPRLIDLSLVRSVEEAERLTYPVGTDAYMAPEQCIPGEGPPIGPPADVWGLAATLYYACSRAIPFPRPDREERYTLADRFPQLEDDPRPLPAHVPDELRQIILSGLRRDPGDRPTASEMAMAFQPLVAQLPYRFVMTKSGWAGRAD